MQTLDGSYLRIQKIYWAKSKPLVLSYPNQTLIGNTGDLSQQHTRANKGRASITRKLQILSSSEIGMGAFCAWKPRLTAEYFLPLQENPVFIALKSK